MIANEKKPQDFTQSAADEQFELNSIITQSETTMNNVGQREPITLDTNEFFKRIYGSDAPDLMSIFCLKGKIASGSYMYPASEAATSEDVRKKIMEVSPKFHTYFSMGTVQLSRELQDPEAIGTGKIVRARKESNMPVDLTKAENKDEWAIVRGTVEEVTSISALWLDVDCAEGIHAKKVLPTFEQALEILTNLPSPPAIRVNSGGGYHLYWPFTKRWLFKDEGERKRANELVKRFARMINEWGKYQMEKRFDVKVEDFADTSRTDLASVLRVPGSINHKGEDKLPVVLEEIKDTQFTLEQLEAMLDELEQKLPAPEQKTQKKSKHPFLSSGEIPLADADPIFEECAFMRHCKEDAANLPEPDWHAGLSVILHTKGGRELAHEVSSPYHKYNKAETDKKIDSILGSEYKPYTCPTIWDKCGSSFCEGCEHRGKINSPIALGMKGMTVEGARRVVDVALEQVKAEGSPKPLLGDQLVLGALALLESNPVEWADLKSQLPKIKVGKQQLIGIKTLNDALKQYKIKTSGLRLAEAGETSTLSEVFPDIPLPDLVPPNGWKVNNEGIWQSNKDGFFVRIFPAPLIITKRLRLEGNEKVEVSCLLDGHWKSVQVNRVTIAKRSDIVGLAAYGFPMDSENAKDVIRYLTAFDQTNREVIPSHRAVDRLGWIDDKTFLPGVENGAVDVGNATKGYTKAGRLEDWLSFAATYRQYPITRFMLAAAFAAPLLKIVGWRNFFIYVFEKSKAGKTAAETLALSTWGNPEDIMVTFNATAAGLEHQAARTSDLPLGIDERQMAGDTRQDFLNKIVYMLAGGKNKLRARKDGGLRDIETWKNIVIATGEEPLIEDGARNGQVTRVMQLCGKPIPDEQQASAIYGFVRDNHGTAGPAFMEKVIRSLQGERVCSCDSCLKSPTDYFRHGFESINDLLRDTYGDRNVSSHISSVAVVCLADYLLSHWFYNLDDKESTHQAFELGKTILDMLDTADEADEATRAMEFFQSWYPENFSKFTTAEVNLGDSGTNVRYGFTKTEGKTNWICVFSHVFNKAFSEHGFSPNSVKRSWAERGWIKTVTKGGKERHTVPEWDNKTATRPYCVLVKMNIDEL